MSKRETKKHIENVRKELRKFIIQLEDRGLRHDLSKLESPEVEIFDKFTPLLKGSEYGSEEYVQFLAEMGPALDNHYKSNRHHPEHFENGIDDMTLVDIVEMFSDWKAAVLRHDTGNILKSIKINAKRFSLSPQLVKIFINTVESEEKL